MENQAVYTELKALLDKFDLTKAWAARQLNITPAYIGAIIVGRALPSAQLVQDIILLRDRLKSSGLKVV